MEFMKDWIAPLVETALRQCLDSPPPPGVRPEELGKTDDDDSSFRIPVRRPKHVQLVKWSDGDSLAKAILSDSFTTIHGIFTSKAQNRHKQKWKTDIKRNTKGSIIQIKNCEITLGKILKEPPEIYLYIQGMDMLGCEGTGVFGYPHQITDRTSINALVKRCLKESGQRNRHAADQELNGQEEDSDKSSRQPQLPALESESILHDSSVNVCSTQANLSTQVPNDGLIQIPNVADNLPKLPQSNFNNKQLLDIIPSKDTYKTSNLPLTSSRKQQHAKRNILQATVPSPRGSSMANDISSHRKEPNSEGSRRTVPTLHSPIPGSKSCPPAYNGESISSDHRPDLPKLAKGVHTPDTVALTPTKRFTSKEKTPTPKPGNALSSHEDFNLARKSSLQGQSRSRVSFKGWKRIGRRDLFISEDQQALIDSCDSWIPPETGKRMPQGHVPIELLRYWNSLHGKDTASFKDTSPAHDQQLDSQCGAPMSPTTSVLPDSELGQSQWSPSPVRCGNKTVPPDSSPPDLMRVSNLSTSRFLSLTKSQDRIDETADVMANDIESSAPKSELWDEQEGSDDSEMEFSIPKGLDTSTQEQCNSPTFGDESIGAVEPSLLTEKTTSFMQVKHTQHDGPTMKPIRNPTNIASDILVPATYDTECSKNQPQSSGNSKYNYAQPPSSVSIQNPSSCNISPMKDGEITRESDVSSEPINRAASNQDWSLDLAHPPHPSLGTGEEVSQLSSSHLSRSPSQLLRDTKRKADGVGDLDLRPAKQSKPSQPNTFNASATTVDRRQTFFGREFRLSRTQEVYSRFQQAYTVYKGDVGTFRNSCCKLQSLRTRGFMQQSFLWDDFVAREATEYQGYVSDCNKRHIVPDKYEHYFQTNTNAARFKKRSLTAKNLQLVLAEAETENNKIHSEAESKQSKVNPIDHRIRRMPLKRHAGAIEESPPPDVQNDILIDEVDEPISECNSDLEAYDLHETASEELGSEDYHLSQAARKVSQQMNSRNSHPRKPITLSKNEIEQNNHTRKEIEYKPSTIRRPMYPPYEAPGPSNEMAALSTAAQSQPESPSTKWWQQPNTPFKMFARGFYKLPSELGFQNEQNNKAVPTDHNGVFMINPSVQDKTQEGKMNSMGFRFQ